VKTSPLPLEFKLGEDWGEQENSSSDFPHSHILASSDLEGENLFRTKSVVECLQRATSPVAGCLGTVYSKHASSKVQPKCGRWLFLAVVMFSPLVLIFY